MTISSQMLLSRAPPVERRNANRAVDDCSRATVTESRRIQSIQDFAQRRQSRRGNFCQPGLAQWLEEHAFQLQGLTPLEINQRRSLVSAHRSRAGNLFFSDGLRNLQ